MPDEKTIFNSIPDINYEEKAPTLDAEAFVQVVESRRSVRVFTDDPIPPSVMERCLDLALLAPNSSNLQPWTFYWPRQEATKKAVVKACLSQPAAATAKELIVAVARTGTWPRHRLQLLEQFAKIEGEGQKVPESAWHYYRKLVPLVYNVGPFGLFAPLRWLMFHGRGLSEPTPREPIGANDLKTWAVKSTALACENFMLAMRAYGYDTCPMEGYDRTLLKKACSLPKDATVVMVISAGKRSAKGVYGPRFRLPREQFIKEI